jgi:hypothetical protein
MTHEEMEFHAKWLLESEGFITEREHQRILYHVNRKAIIDVIGYKGTFIVAVECGTLSFHDKLNALSDYYDLVLWIRMKGQR